MFSKARVLIRHSLSPSVASAPAMHAGLFVGCWMSTQQAMFSRDENACPRSGGRPRLSDDARRTVSVSLRLRQDEHRQLVERARELGRPLSVHIREAALGAELPRLANRAAYRELTRVGVNLNQLARWANTFRAFPELQKLHAVLDELMEVRKKL